jgi:hypothetical protein
VSAPSADGAGPGLTGPATELALLCDCGGIFSRGLLPIPGAKLPFSFVS